MAQALEETGGPGGHERGIFDCEEAHHSPQESDYQRIFQSGLVVLDTNVLLNLYRSNQRTREDTLAALSKLRDRLWIPHQVLTEFWRNRELRAVRHHHGTKAKEACAALTKVGRSTEDALDRWVTAVHLKNDTEVTQRIDEALETLSETVRELTELIQAQAEKDALTGTAATHTDPVLTRLEPLLRGRIGEPLSPGEHDKAVQEAQERADEEIPPGYEDFRSKPPEQAAGDYLLWVQLLQEASRRDCDVLLVTGDVKKDWWISQEGDLPARPRTELVVELREHAGAQLFMLTPGQLLSWAEKLLDVQVDESSVSDLEQLRGTETAAESSTGGWTIEPLMRFMGELLQRYPAQAKVVTAAAVNGGFVDRSTVYDLAGYPDDRTLKGFTRPISTVSRELEDEGVLTGEEPFLLHTIYGMPTEPSWASGFRIPSDVVALLQGNTDEPRTPGGSEPPSGD
ncbi:PIN-like domain-containing protein [Streptomyces sp. NPDC001922]|uniref:PIN-like domain-containing protein n=1 Tax=Streptomyces sp. NPDC001922 TaxID=3364624 RepID=UPI003694DD94